MPRDERSAGSGPERKRTAPFRKSAYILKQAGDHPSLRLLGFGLCCTVWFALVLLFLCKYQVLLAGHFKKKADKQQQGTIEVRAARGVIRDRFSEKLAFSIAAESIGVFPQQVANPELAAALLSEVLGIGKPTLYAKLTRERFQWIKRLAEPGEAERVRNLNISGIHFEEENKRYYPHGTVASHVLGAVGVDHTGQAGLEQHYEELLSGEPGVRLLQYDAKRSSYAARMLKEPVAGADLILTIDHRIQMTAERELDRAIRETQAAAGAIVIMDPQNGELLAVANRPTFDPNERVRDKKDLKRRKNFAFSTLIEPGSSFKIMTFAAAIEEKLTTPGEILDCQMGVIYIGSRRVRDHKPLGLLTVSEAFARSSNVGAIKLGLRLEPVRLYEYARAFGFGQETGLPLPGETSGLLRPVKRWHRDSIGSIPMGHEIGVTAIQMARAASVIANGGMLIQPRLIREIRHPDGVIEKTERKELGRVISAETAAVIRGMMERVVQTGTGRHAQTPGYRVAGKTGTPQKVDPETGVYSRKLYVPNFVGFAPLNNPSILVVIVLDSPVGDYYAGLVAAPVFPRVVTQALRFRDVPPELPLEPRKESEFQIADDLERDATEGTSQDSEEFADEGHEQRGGGPVVVAATSHSVRWPTSLGATDSEELDRLGDGRTTSERLSIKVADRLLPDFKGKTVREVVSESAALGLEVELRGSGFAYRQRPRAGAPILSGQRVAVEFAPGPRSKALDDRH